MACAGCEKRKEALKALGHEAVAVVKSLAEQQADYWRKLAERRAWVQEYKRKNRQR